MPDTRISPGNEGAPTSRRNMDGQSSKIIASDFTFACVQPHAKFDTQLAGGLADGLSAPDGASRAVERSHEPITGGIDLPPTEPAELLSHGSIVSVQERAPKLSPNEWCMSR